MKTDVIEYVAAGLSMKAHSLGEDLPVVLLHGLPDSAQLWRKVAPELVSRGYRVVMPDMRGYGYSLSASPRRWDGSNLGDLYGSRAH